MRHAKVDIYTTTSGDSREAINSAIQRTFETNDDRDIWINAWTDLAEFSNDLARLVWRANGGPCDITVDIDWSRTFPDRASDQFHYCEESYEELSKDKTALERDWGIADNLVIRLKRRPEAENDENGAA